MTEYIKYIGETLHLIPDIAPYERDDALPLYLKTGYTLYLLKLQGVECLLAEPKETQNLAAMRKHCGQIKKITGLHCVLCLEKARAYTREKMIAEAIPFIIAGQQLYMPFLGLALNNRDERELPRVDRISFSTQTLLLTALYKGWRNKKVVEAATDLGFTSMTASRCFDELQALELPLIVKTGRTRQFVWENNARTLWDVTRPMLRNPVIKQYHLGRAIQAGSMKLGGMSAICHYSNLADDPYPVYAVTRKAEKELRLDQYHLIPDGEVAEIAVQVMQYELDFPDKHAVDPLTAILSLPAAELSDPRVEAAVEEILEEYLHG